MTTARPTPGNQGWVALRVLRRKDGHTIVSLAAITPFTAEYLSALEEGTQRPTPQEIDVLAKALNVPKSMLGAPPTQRRVWDALKVLRERDGHTITTLAAATRDPNGKPYTRQYISLLENGDRTPTPAVIKALAKALNVPKSMLERPRATEEGDAA